MSRPRSTSKPKRPTWPRFCRPTKTPWWSPTVAVQACGAYAAAAKKAKELGYTNVKHLSAGISGWKKAGEKTEAGK